MTCLCSGLGTLCHGCLTSLSGLARIECSSKTVSLINSLFKALGSHQIGLVGACLLSVFGNSLVYVVKGYLDGIFTIL